MPAESVSSPNTLSILVAVSHDDASIAAAKYGASLAKRQGMSLGLFHVSEYNPSELLKMKAIGTGEMELARSNAAKTIQVVRDAIEGTEYEEFIRLGDIGDESKAVTNSENPPALLLVGRRKLGTVSRWILGHVSHTIIQTSEVPVLIVPPNVDLNNEGPIVIATDLKAKSKAAFPPALKIAGDREIILLHIQEVEDWASERLDAWTAELKSHGANIRQRTEMGEPISALPKVVSEEKAAMLVVATHGRTGLEKMLAGGSVTEGLLKDLLCPILVVQAE
jgi:nucleotide-binding universal stress UspA family protein